MVTRRQAFAAAIAGAVTLATGTAAAEPVPCTATVLRLRGGRWVRCLFTDLRAGDLHRTDASDPRVCRATSDPYCFAGHWMMGVEFVPPA